MEFHFATCWEQIADTVPNAPALITDESVRTWREFDERAARVAGLLGAHGIGIGAKVATYLHNSNEYVEAQYGAFKIRGCPINVNYRYKAEELVYLLDNADVEAVFYQATYAARIWEIRSRLPRVKLWIQVDDGTESLIDGALDYERSLRQSVSAPRIERAASDLYMLYTGGTTGMPKGVMYTNGDFSRAMCAGFMAKGLPAPESPADLPGLVSTLAKAGGTPVSIPACPVMHGTGMWLGTMIPLLQGGTVVMISKLGFDPDLLFSLVERWRVTDIAIVGDAFARPMLAALDSAAQANDPYDISSLKQIISSGVMFSKEVKQGLLRHHDMTLLDTMGSTEGGMASSVMNRSSSAETAKFSLSPGVKVITDDGREPAAGSGEIGKLATSGLVPIGYYKDPKKSAETFREYNGVRYSFPGDYARIEADGTITLLGRGSVCINTAGEKVFPEEVEEAVKRHPAVYDCLVVGVPDQRFGERVIAVASLREGQDAAPQDVIDFTREHLAGYKTPKGVVIVEEVRRAPNGKADYKWAKQAAKEALGA
jgi:3-oxocholest-4-en-26-oate---CoA ligase